MEEGIAWFCRDAAEAIPDPYAALPTELALELDRLSVQDRLDEMDDPELRDLQDAIWTSLGSGPARETGLVPTALGTFALSGWHTDLLWETNGGYTIAGGTAALVAAFREDLRHAEVRERTKVLELERSEDGVRTITDDGIEHRARACVLAVPVNALRGIAFAPDLAPGRRAVVDRGILGRGFKVWVRIRGEVPHVTAVAPGGHAINYFESIAHVDGETLALGFGARADALDLRDLPAVRSAVTQLVPDVDVIDCGGHDWTRDPLAKTTWGSFRPGQLTRSLAQLQRSELRTFFAGGDIATGWSGYIDGAIGSGIAAGRAARAFLGTG
jgi:pseudooxynicotine oxidase